MFIKLINYTGQELQHDDVILMSHEEFVNGGKGLKNVPVTITPNGEEPEEETNEYTI